MQVLVWRSDIPAAEEHHEPFAPVRDGARVAYDLAIPARSQRRSEQAGGAELSPVHPVDGGGEPEIAFLRGAASDVKHVEVCVAVKHGRLAAAVFIETAGPANVQNRIAREFLPSDAVGRTGNAEPLDSECIL